MDWYADGFEAKLLGETRTPQAIMRIGAVLVGTGMVAMSAAVILELQLAFVAACLTLWFGGTLLFIAPSMPAFGQATQTWLAVSQHAIEVRSAAGAITDKIQADAIVAVEIVAGHLRIHTDDAVVRISCQGNERASVERIRDEIRRIIAIPEEDPDEREARLRERAKLDRLAGRARES